MCFLHMRGDLQDFPSFPFYIYHSKAKETEVSRVPINLQPNKLAQDIVIVTQDTGKWKDVAY